MKNVILIGLGSIGRKHASILKKLRPGIGIYALRSNPNEKEIIDGITNIFSLQEVSLESMDFAILSNPSSLRIEAIQTLMASKMPLFVEKPLSHNIKSVATLIKEFRLSDRLSYMACNLRFLECLNFIKNHLSSSDDRLNEVSIYCGSYLPDWRPGQDFRNSYSAIPSLGGGVHLDLIHEIDYAYWLFGRPNDVNRKLKSTSSLNIESMDYANYNLEYDNFNVNIILNYYRKDVIRNMELVFENYSLKCDLLKNAVYDSTGNKLLFTDDREIKDTYLSQMKYFLSLIESESVESVNTMYDGFEVLKICLGNED